MTDSSNYIHPKVWEIEANNMSTFSKTNRPITGSTHEKMLPVGNHPLQIYSLATPNGVKVTILLEELIELGEEGAEYDAHLIRISEGDQFGSGFVDINPNSKIPALVDRSGDVPLRVFESGAILLYLAEKFNLFIPNNHSSRTECLSWLFWQMGSAPYLGGGFGHFYHYANEKIKYPIDRFAMEVKRQLDVLNKHLDGKEYMVAEEYTIADIAIWPWYGLVALGTQYDAGEFLQVDKYKNVVKWAKNIGSRPTVERARMINRITGDEMERVEERHDKSDLKGKSGIKV